MNLPPMNWGLWWAQIRAVIRLEMRKTFFAKRGIWVYLLALAPAALFCADSIAVIHDRDRRAEEASTHQISRETGANSVPWMVRGEDEERGFTHVRDPVAPRIHRLGLRHLAVVSRMWRAISDQPPLCV